MGIVRFNFCCKNDECELAWKTVQVEKDMSLEDEEELCDECEQTLKQLGHIAAGGYLAMSAMPLERKKEVLKKRSKDHFVKSGLKERKMAMLKGNFTGKNVDSADYNNQGKRIKGR